MDLEKLTPKQAGSVPWRHSQMNNTDWAFYELARNAFDIQMRRGWTPLKAEATAIVPNDGTTKSGRLVLECLGKCHRPDPFTALVEADRFYRENVENIK